MIEDVFGTSDCERIREGLLCQPVNALTSLGFVAAGGAIGWKRRDRRELAILTSLVGVGSFLAHGPRWRGSAWLHDVTIVWVLAGVGLSRRRPPLRGAVYALLGAAFLRLPLPWRNAVGALVAAAVIGREVADPRRRGRPALIAFGLLGAGAAIGNAWRTGSPLCRPDSIWQGHGAWHLLAASALAAWGIGTPAPETGGGQSSPRARSSRSRTSGTESAL